MPGPRASPPPPPGNPAKGELATRLSGWDHPAVGAFAPDGARLPSTKYARRAPTRAASARDPRRRAPRANVAVPFASDPPPLREFLWGARGVAAPRGSFAGGVSS